MIIVPLSKKSSTHIVYHLSSYLFILVKRTKNNEGHQYAAGCETSEPNLELFQVFLKLLSMNNLCTCHSTDIVSMPYLAGQGMPEGCTV